MKRKSLEENKVPGIPARHFKIPLPNANLAFFGKKCRLVVEYKKNCLTLAVSSRRQLVHVESIALRENPPDRVRAKAARFLSQLKYEERLLVLPRSEILLKEVELPETLNAYAEGPAGTGLEKFFPCSPTEMAWGILAPEKGSARGLLFAIPDAKISEILEFLSQRGLDFDEVVSEDQLLGWLLLEQGKTASVLCFDQGEERILSAFFMEGRLCFSKSFAVSAHRTFEEMSKDIFDEISLALLEMGEKPGEVFLSGHWHPEEVVQIKGQFGVPVNPVEGSHASEFSSFLLGAACSNHYPRVSLLTLERKLERKTRQEKKLVAGLFVSFFLWMGILVLAFMLHDRLNAFLIRQVDHDIQALVPDVSEAKKTKALLENLNRARKTKETLLLFQKELSQRTPASVRLLEFRLEGDQMRFKGESPSHAFLSETVRAIGETKVVASPQIEQTRMRKRQNEDYFEFEVAGRWTL